MSNHLAVATVTEALREFIARNLTDLPLAVNVSAQRPPTEPPADPTITIFCYSVNPDPQMRNLDAPTRASDGTLIRLPRAALDLDYLISFYGDESQLVPQRLLGCVVRALYVEPILSHDDIVAAQAQPFLAGSDLGTSPQRVRFTPTHQDTDELYRLWTMMTGTQMALSLTYQATLVFIDGTETPATGQEVRTRNITVTPSVPADIAGAPLWPNPPMAGRDGSSRPTRRPSPPRSRPSWPGSTGSPTPAQARQPIKPRAQPAHPGQPTDPGQPPGPTQAQGRRR
jgi:hypothetical protein